jgi:GMP synthase-like glutamine amidotransferase
VKPIAIFRFSPEDGPGYFASFLDRHAVSWTLFNLDEGAAVPENTTDYAGLVFMGGPMSVHDSLPWIPPILQLVRNAISKDQPCLGHCLGGQLMSIALGGNVTQCKVKEIGWNKIKAIDSVVARNWLGESPRQLTTFQWHNETFSIPSGAERILTGDACTNQAFVIGKSLAMQCHTEMMPEMIEDWCQDWAMENADPMLASIQTPAAMLAAMKVNIPKLNSLADQLYSKWLEGVYPRG